MNKCKNPLHDAEIERAARVFEQRGIHSDHLELVEDLKLDASVLLARIDRIAIPPNNREAGRLVALAKTSVEEAVMWATKAISRYNPSPSERAQPSGDAKA